MRRIVLSIIYIAGKAFGWCLLSFMVLWAVMVGIQELSDLSYAALGLGLLAMSELALIELSKI